MKITNLVEFQNKASDTLRAIEVLPHIDPKSTGVVFMGGFERNTTCESQFKVLADFLVSLGFGSFRFDYTGLGLSDGDFQSVSNSRMVEDLGQAVKTFSQRNNFTDIIFVTHSNSACVLVNSEFADSAKKIVFLAPALDQKSLHRYWFTQKSVAKVSPETVINWTNFREYLDETAFLQFCNLNPKMTKSHYLDAAYHLESAGVDYTDLATNHLNKSLLIIGDQDKVTPLESIRLEFPHKIIVAGGDHSLHRPDMLAKWVTTTVDFISTV
jgi:pimeloyl-ACP methyl ester carboxylesterase